MVEETQGLIVIGSGAGGDPVAAKVAAPGLFRPCFQSGRRLLLLQLSRPFHHQPKSRKSRDLFVRRYDDSAGNQSGIRGGKEGSDVIPKDTKAVVEPVGAVA